jgi:hypothetical protein
MSYRVYCNGRDFGIDYANLETARAARAIYARYWPKLRYYIRKVRNAQS